MLFLEKKVFYSCQIGHKDNGPVTWAIVYTFGTFKQVYKDIQALEDFFLHYSLLNSLKGTKIINK